MIDPFLDSLAAALAGQAAAALGSAGTKALDKVRELVRRKAQQDPETQRALEAAEAPSASQTQVKALAERLDHAVEQDPEFAEQLRTEGAAVHNDITASNGGVVMHNSGTVDKLIQTNEIHGDITFN